MLENLQCVTEFSCSNRDYPCETKERENALWISVYFYFFVSLWVTRRIKKIVFIPPSVFSNRARKKINLKLCLEI